MEQEQEQEQQQQTQNVTEHTTENDLQVQTQHLEMEKKKMREEFDIQRAKMKELFLQKEGELSRKNQENIELAAQIQQLKTELDDVKSQLVVAGLTLESNFEVEKRKAEEEIASLQQLVHETVEESTSSRTIYDSELRRMHVYIKKLQSEIEELRSEKEKQQSPHHTIMEQTSLAPSVMLSAVTKRLVKKLGADAFTSQDSVEDNMRKAQEDAEVLRSLVVPLEEEIKALKDKLRATDEQLQKCRQCGHVTEQDALTRSSPLPALSPSHHASTATNTSFDASKLEPSPPPPCDMCCNYEAQLVKEQQKALELEANVATAEKAAERHKEELRKEIGFRKDMEEKWNEKKEEHKQQIAVLSRQTECAEQDLKELQQCFDQTRREMKETLAKLTRDREKVQQELIQLQNENDKLVGKYTIHSQQLQSEFINLPDTVEELQELVLKSHQELIIEKLGKETAEETVNNLKSDIMLLRDQITNDYQERQSLENSLVTEIDALKKQKHILEKEKKQAAATYEKLESSEKQLRSSLIELQAKNNEVMLHQKQVEDQNSELRTQIGSLQQELDTSETVQKDFVQLSQSLQIQLEKIRDSDTQVRWQHEEDVDECPTCRSAFTVKKKKEHCRHCGTIFCASCLSHVVRSGPNMRPSKVCDVCHTLLVKSSAPYFSEAPPQNN